MMTLRSTVSLEMAQLGQMQECVHSGIPLVTFFFRDIEAKHWQQRFWHVRCHSA